AQPDGQGSSSSRSQRQQSPAAADFSWQIRNIRHALRRDVVPCSNHSNSRGTWPTITDSVAAVMTALRHVKGVRPGEAHVVIADVMNAGRDEGAVFLDLGGHGAYFRLSSSNSVPSTFGQRLRSSSASRFGMAMKVCHPRALAISFSVSCCLLAWGERSAPFRGAVASEPSVRVITGVNTELDRHLCPVFPHKCPVFVSQMSGVGGWASIADILSCFIPDICSGFRSVSVGKYTLLRPRRVTLM